MRTGVDISDLTGMWVTHRTFTFEGSPRVESNGPLGLATGAAAVPMIVMVRVAGTHLVPDGDDWRREDVLEITRAVVLDDEGQEYLIDLIRAAGDPTLFDQPETDGNPTDVGEPKEWPGFAAMGGGAITLPPDVLAAAAPTVVQDDEPPRELSADEVMADIDDEWPEPAVRRRRDEQDDEQPAPEPGLDDAVTLRQIRPGDKHLSKFLREDTGKERRR